MKHGTSVFYYRALNEQPFREKELCEYLDYCSCGNLPPKIMTTYDSFESLTISLNNLKYPFTDFRIVVDECQCLLTDALMKGDTELKFMKAIYQYPNLLFISATPLLEKYIDTIPEFQSIEHFYELQWNPNLVRNIHKDFNQCKSTKDGFKKIYEQYLNSGNNEQERYFDLRRYAGGHIEYSREACVFLNSVNDIVWIIKKYSLKTEDVNIICSERDENRKKLATLKGELANTIGCAPVATATNPYPIHKRWTFITKCSFEGTDFVSTNASTYVLCNYNIECLSIDIAADLVQIAGRQRLPENQFRDVIHIYYTMNKNSVMDDDAFEQRVQEKIRNSQSDISNFNNAHDKMRQLQQINQWNKTHIADSYITTFNLFPEINPILIAAEQRNYEIFRDHKDITVFNNGGVSVDMVDPTLKQLSMNLDNPAIQYPRERIKVIHDYLILYPGMENQVMELLFFLKPKYGDLAKYFTSLSLDVIRSKGYDTWKMDNYLLSQSSSYHITQQLCQVLSAGQTYTRKEVKLVLQNIYDNIGLNQRAKATDLNNYITCKEVKKNGEKAYMII